MNWAVCWRQWVFTDQSIIVSINRIPRTLSIPFRYWRLPRHVISTQRVSQSIITCVTCTVCVLAASRSRYISIATIGQGSFGTVAKMWDRDKEQLIAVKKMQVRDIPANYIEIYWRHAIIDFRLSWEPMMRQKWVLAFCLIHNMQWMSHHIESDWSDETVSTQEHRGTGGLFQCCGWPFVDCDGILCWRKSARQDPSSRRRRVFWGTSDFLLQTSFGGAEISSRGDEIFPWRH